MDLNKAKSIIQLNDYLTLEEFNEEMLNEFTGTYKYRVCSVYFIDENKFDFYFIFYIRYGNDLDKVYIKIPNDIKEHLSTTYTNIYNLINKQITKDSLNDAEQGRLTELIDKYFHKIFFAEKSIYKYDDINFEKNNILIKIISTERINPYKNLFENCTSLESLPPNFNIGIISLSNNNNNNNYGDMFK